MGIKHLSLENFRCYSELQVNFKPGLNLLIGNNASGKTTLLKACRYVLSSFFAGYSDDNTSWLSPNNDDFTIKIVNGSIEHEDAMCISFSLYDWLSPDEIFKIEKKSKKNSRPLIGKLKAYRDYSRNLLSSAGPLPVFASFTTEDIHQTRKINANKFKAYNHKRSFGYYECLNGSGFLPFWQKRLLVLKEANKGAQEIAVVRQAVIDCLGEGGCNVIKDMKVRHNQGEVYYTYIDGREVPTALVSDGYRRLVNIVTDLACRCSLLNGQLFGIDCVKKTQGTVLIDEIDMHLHPQMQARVLKGLKNAFPNLQFIVSSHAPMVMTNVENNEHDGVLALDYHEGKGYSIVPSSTYGLDASTITECILGQDARNHEVNEKLRCLFLSIDNDDFENANQQLKELKEQFGEQLPDLAKAQTMISFLADGDEKD